ncbi:hypothetical protein [Nocardioides sediminis]|uniref:hypothetical protein n=1 Tax=Nocardioides sediminis TaxID=433648 RepID=UPI000D2F769F|nr:hypothetical protein [Nocardioides sediminis]
MRGTRGHSCAWLITFHGPSTLDGWNLQPLLEEADDVDASLEHMKYFDDMVDGDQTVYALDEEVPL